MRTYRPDDGGWHKSYCVECGSQLFTTNPENPELKGVRLGVLDGDPGVRPSAHQFVDYALGVGAGSGRRPSPLSPSASS